VLQPAGDLRLALETGAVARLVGVSRLDALEHDFAAHLLIKGH
jgi:hypothetical protein